MSTASTSFYAIHPPNRLLLQLFISRLKRAKRKAGKGSVTANLVLRRYLGDIEEGRRKTHPELTAEDHIAVNELLRKCLAKKHLTLAGLQLEKKGRNDIYELFCARVTV